MLKGPANRLYIPLSELKVELCKISGKKTAFHLFFSLIIFLSYVSFAYTAPSLTIEDDIIMSQMVKNSTQTDELQLFLKLFPDSPYYKDIEQRLFRIEIRHVPRPETGTFFNPAKTKGVTWTVSPTLTHQDELAMSRMVRKSDNIKEINLFLKIFPNSPFKDLMEQRKKTLEQTDNDETQSDSLKKIEAAIVKKSIQQQDTTVAKATTITKAAPTNKSPTPVEQKTENKTPQKEEEPVFSSDHPEADWGKIEFGAPYAIKLQETDGTDIETKGKPQGIILGWSGEIGLDVGLGGAIEYFSQKLKNDTGELRHLFFETQLKARLLGHINLGVGYGVGYTTIELETNPDNRDITPGEGTIKSMTIGTRIGSVGINYIVADFTGAYRWRVNSGANSSNGKEKWKGTTNMMTIEFLF